MTDSHSQTMHSKLRVLPKCDIVFGAEPTNFEAAPARAESGNDEVEEHSRVGMCVTNGGTHAHATLEHW